MKNVLVPYTDEKPQINNEKDNVVFIKNTTDIVSLDKQLCKMGILFDAALLPMGQLHTFDSVFLGVISKFVKGSGNSLSDLKLPTEAI